MLTILNLFGRSPFAPFQKHMEQVSECVSLLADLFTALKNDDKEKVAALATSISELEHQADVTKRDIRNHLPKRIYLPVDKNHLLEMLSIQDTIADKAEDIAIMVTLKDLNLPPDLQAPFDAFLQKNLEAFDGVRHVIQEFTELLETSFGGTEANKVRTMVDAVAYNEHEADLLQRGLFKGLIMAEDQLKYSDFYLWSQTFEAIASISNLSEKLAYRMRMMLELK